MTLYLHVGAHKTGTTTIQQFSAARRALLMSRGLYYPDFTEIGRAPVTMHHSFAHAVAGRETRPPFGDADLSALALFLAARSREQDVLISAEPIFRHVLGEGDFAERHRRYVERLAAILDAVPRIVPVIVLRRQDSFAASMVQEQIKTTLLARTLSEFAAENIEFMNYEQHVRLLEEVFGPARVLIYEHICSGDGLVRNFFGALGVKLSEEEGRFRPSNSSIHPAVALYKQRLNRQNAVPPGLRQHVLTRVSRELFGNERRSLFTGEELDAVFARYEASNARLARHLGLPENSRLFPDREPLPPLYRELSEADFHRIDERVAELLAEDRANRLRRLQRPRGRTPFLRRLLRKLGIGGVRK